MGLGSLEPVTCFMVVAADFSGILSLDDRPVRDSERKASRLQFASEESLNSKQSFPAVFTAGRYEQKWLFEH